MDFYQGVVAEYIAADRACFVSGEYTLPRKNGTYFLIDILAVSLKEERAYLCEVTYSKALKKIIDKMKHYHQEHDDILERLHELCGIPTNWTIMPWLFVLKDHRAKIRQRLNAECPECHVRITNIEDVGPWSYSIGYRRFEKYVPTSESS